MTRTHTRESQEAHIAALEETITELATSLLFIQGYITWLKIAVHGMNAASEENRKQVFPTVADIAGRIEAFAIERGDRAHEILTGAKPIKH